MPILRILLLYALSTPLAAAPIFVHCYDFGCKSTQELRFNDAHWRDIKAIFKQSQLDPDEEKQAIRRAVALMERISGDLSGTHLDKAGNYPGYDLAGQMDCIDESTNTFQYLLALEQMNLLNWHRVGLKQRRIVWFVTHWTATITEIGSNDSYAVDSWYRDNGELPFIQPLADWKRKRDFAPDFNPELASN
jgi:hypothetical protein